MSKQNKEKQLQIPESLFVQLAKYFVLEQESEELKEIIKKGIQKKIDDKIEGDIKHDLYTKSLTAPTAEEREKARQEYLDKRGIPKDFRW